MVVAELNAAPWVPENKIMLSPECDMSIFKSKGYIFNRRSGEMLI